MKKFGFAAVAAAGIAAGFVGFAAPAQAISSITVPAGIDHQTWINDITPHVNVPQVDTSVHN